MYLLFWQKAKILSTLDTSAIESMETDEVPEQETPEKASDSERSGDAKSWVYFFIAVAAFVNSFTLHIAVISMRFFRKNRYIEKELFSLKIYKF